VLSDELYKFFGCFYIDVIDDYVDHLFGSYYSPEVFLLSPANEENCGEGKIEFSNNTPNTFYETYEQEGEIEIKLVKEHKEYFVKVIIESITVNKDIDYNHKIMFTWELI